MCWRPRRAGPSGAAETFGHAAIVDPWGRVLAQQDQGEAVLLAERDSRRTGVHPGAHAGVQSPALFSQGAQRPASERI
jgi:predicted amidohydrolase